jgi:hypothetical protein
LFSEETKHVASLLTEWAGVKFAHEDYTLSGDWSGAAEADAGVEAEAEGDHSEEAHGCL